MGQINLSVTPCLSYMYKLFQIWSASLPISCWVEFNLWTLEVRDLQIPPEKDNHRFYLSPPVPLSRNAFGSELGYVAGQWRIGFYCRLYPFSLNYRRQTSWLAAMQNSEGSCPGGPKVGSPLVGEEKRKGKFYLFWCVSPPGFPLKIDSVVDSWFWVVRYMMEFFWCKPLVSGLQTL